MNYCILNGIKSTLIKGLLIQSLPPISKPLMRTEIEEIDGRDGDVVTKLGYSAYDKAMTIGLFGDFDIDEVIQFFDSEGTVIFSNEPDKFYNYKILDQIDFERLLRFKTATVTFHVQPFKYSAVDDAFIVSKNRLDINPFSKTAGGVTVDVENGVLSISGTANRPMDFFVPIKRMTLGVGSYTLKAECDGVGETGCELRIIGSVPNDADSFGNTSYQLDETVEDTVALLEEKSFNYLWISVNETVEFDLYIQIIDNALSSFKVFNRGNTISRPTLTVYGTGTVGLLINGAEAFSLNLENGSYITLDGEEMNAYKGDVLMNRYVTGNFNSLVLKSGMNIISWIGDVSQISVEKIGRWI
jgi:predicted phage tail component-like protein